MTSRDLIILSYLALAVVAVVLVVASRRRPDRIATFAETIHALGRPRAIRLVLVLTWAWLGWHFLAR